LRTVAIQPGALPKPVQVFPVFASSVITTAPPAAALRVVPTDVAEAEPLFSKLSMTVFAMP
jgi:hypothetical protein